MALKEKPLRLATGFVLAVATLLTRLPFRAHTFFEFDSINFAVAIFRFSLREVTPQMPGYILHVLLGRLLYTITGDLNSAYLWLSMLLSIGSVLFLWRAAAQMRGERVAIIAALIWLTTPLFWFQGEVAAVYAHEAFFTAWLLYLGMKLLNDSKRYDLVYLLLIVFSLATGARQSSILFFLPAIVFLLWKIHISKKHLFLAVVGYVIITTLWFGELVRESGGLSTYLYSVHHESIFKSQSVLFGNSWQSEFDTISKVAFYLPIAMGASILALIAILLTFPLRTLRFARAFRSNPKALYIVLIALPALLFYFFIFFMKAGYFLNVIPSAILIIAVLIDQAAIWLAEFEKRRSENKLQFTRPIITRNVAMLTSAVMGINCLWFFVRWPGTDQTRFNNEDTRNSFIRGAVNRFDDSQDRWLTLANRAFAYTNVSGFRAVDSLNDMTLRALEARGANDSNSTIIATWWSRWTYLLLPHANTYDVEPGIANTIAVGYSRELHRENIFDSVTRIHSSGPMLLLMRHDRTNFAEVNKQLHLERLSLPEYLDIYKILDTGFTLRLQDRTFLVNRSQ